MKTALCLFGEPRSIDVSFKGIQECILNPNNIDDVFCHFWHTPENVGKLYNTTKNGDGSYIVPNLFVRAETPSLAVELYKPKSIRIDRHMTWSAEKFGRPEYTCYDVIPATQSMACSINRCWNLLEEYEIANGFRYDAVIMTRPDIILRNHIEISQLNLDKFTSNCECSHLGGINYWMGIGSRDNMEKYAELFYNMEKVFKTGIKFIPEIVVATWVRDFCKIPLAPILPSYGVLR